MTGCECVCSPSLLELRRGSRVSRSSGVVAACALLGWGIPPAPSESRQLTVHRPARHRRLNAVVLARLAPGRRRAQAARRRNFSYLATSGRALAPALASHLRAPRPRSGAPRGGSALRVAARWSVRHPPPPARLGASPGGAQQAAALARALTVHAVAEPRRRSLAVRLLIFAALSRLSRFVECRRF